MFPVQHQKSHSRSRSNARNTRTTRVASLVSHPLPEKPESGVIEWTKNTYYCVSKLPGIPRFFERLNLSSPISGSTDSTTGYSMIITLSGVFIWAYVSNELDPPAIEFPLPEQSFLPLANLVAPSAGADEPGLLIVMANGYAAYWESIGDAVAEVMMKKRGVEGQIAMSQSDVCIDICNSEPAGFIVRTNSGKLFHLVLRDASGKPSINITQMGASGFWRYFGSTKEGIVAVRPGRILGRGERQVLSMTHDGGLDIWDVSRTGENKLNLQLQLEASINQQLQTQSGKLEFQDIAHVPDTYLIMFMFTTNGSSYISTFDYQHMKNTSLLLLSRNPSSSGRIYLPLPGKSVFVVYSNMIFVLNDPGSYTFQDVIEFDGDINLLCSGQENIMPKKRNPGVVIISKNNGAIRVETFKPPKGQAGDFRKSKIEQAVFYSFIEKNPLKFSRQVEGSEIENVEISQEILTSRSKYIPPLLPSLKDHLSLRSKSLVRLATYLQDTVLSQETRNILLLDLEKVEAARRLWDAWNDFHDTGEDVLSTIVKDIIGDKISGDILRSFFTSFVNEIPKVIPKANAISLNSTCNEQSNLTTVYEASEIILRVLRTAYKVRDERKSLYQVTEDPQMEPWACTESVLQAVSSQYELAIASVKTAKEHELSEKIVGQLVRMADVLCRGFEEHVKWGGIESREVLETKRGTWIKALTQFGQNDKAFEIAERYHSFQILVEMCLDEELEARVRRLSWYLYIFKEQFAETLYAFYVKRGEMSIWCLSSVGMLKDLLTQFPEYHPFLTTFLEKGNFKRISWMHHVKLGEFTKASKTLQEIKEPDLWNRKIELGIAKLCACIANQPLDALTQSLDILNIQSNFRESLQPIIRDALDSEAAVQLIMAENKWIRKAPHHGVLLRRLVYSILSNEVLGIEDMVDILTLHTGPPSRFYVALQLLKMAEISDTRLSLAVRTVWRRLFLADDWIKIVETKNKSDEQVSKQTRQTALYEVILKEIANALLQSQSKFRPLFPGEALFLPSDESTLRLRFRNLKEVELVGLIEECEAANQLLKRYEDNARLSMWVDGLTKDAENQVLNDGFAIIDAEDVMDE